MAELNETLEMLSAIVFEYDGTLDHFGVGTLKAFWGAPVVMERQNESALRAAFEMRSHIVGLNQKRISRGEPPLSICMGLHSGVMLAGYLGTDQHSDYTVLGTEAEKAEALARQAAPDQILVSGPIEKWLSSTAVFKSITTHLPVRGTGTETIYEAVTWGR
jgi:adenylate cyclase